MQLRIGIILSISIIGTVVLIVGLWVFTTVLMPTIWESFLIFVNPILSNMGLSPISDSFQYYHYFTDSFLDLSFRDFMIYTWRQLIGFIILLFPVIICLILILYHMFVQHRERNERKRELETEN